MTPDSWIVVALVSLSVGLVGLSIALAVLLVRHGRAEAELRHLAMFDSLTEVFNRRAFMELAEREIARARRAGVPSAVLMMDLDHFKRVNDRHGHATGDLVLAQFAATVKRSLRTHDVLGRYGGEEFCALLPETGLEEALIIAERIRAAVARRPIGGLPAPITVSMGISVNEGETLDSALAKADEMLYRAKRSGRNRVEACSARDSSHPAPDRSPKARTTAM